MKRILFLMLVSANLAFSQGYNWITPNKTYLKMYVAEDGIYRINKQDFNSAGINTSGIDPRTVKVLYKGLQVPIYFFGEQDGVFNDNDYFDFYGKRNYGGQTITYKASNDTLAVADYTTDEYFNAYSDTSAYWVDWGGNNGLRFIDYGFTTVSVYPYQYHYVKTQLEKDSVYNPGEHRSNEDYRYFNNEKISGEGWYWKELQFGNTTLASFFNLPDLYGAPQICTVKIFAFPNSYSDTIFNEHSLIIRVNNINVDTVYTNDYRRIDTVISFSSSVLANGQNQISVIYKGAGSYVGHMYYDGMRLSYPSRFEFQSNRISFEAGLSDTSAKVFKIKGFVSANELSIYDVNNNLRITQHSAGSDTLVFSGKGNGKFEIANSTITKKPFRIKQKQVPDLLSSSNGADYLIVYNKLFEIQAEQLRQYRNTRDGFRSHKVEVEDIYDIFNFGMESPAAVRNFTKYVYNNWQQPKFRYLCLFGRGSLDPKGNSPSSVYYSNLVPVYGSPPSDGYFANFGTNSTTYFHQVAIGRIPALTVQEASDIVNKTIAYENQSSNPENFFKTFIFITGGQNRSEQIQFANQSDAMINTYVYPPSVTGYPVRIYRNDSAGGVTYSYSDSIKSAINRGGLITNYIGHAGSNTWDNGMDDPGILANQNRLSLILSMTCFTGKNAETEYRSFGEKFLNLNNRGAIGFVGSTGWSFSVSGNTLNGYILKSFAADTVRRTGDLVRHASEELYSEPVSFASQNTINCYELLGDPAATLLMPTYPEYAIDLSNYKLSNPFPSVREPVTLTIFPRNLGIYSDSIKIRFRLFKNSVPVKVKDTLVHGFGFIDTLNYIFSLDSAGNYSMNIFLDPDHWNTKEITTNNSITFPINLKNLSFIPLKPVDNQVVNGDTIIITGINPNVSRDKSVKLFLQTDTSAFFNSPLSRTYFTTNIQGVITRFGYGVPVKDSGTVYYWRMNSVINNTDTSGWSETRRFITGSPYAYRQGQMESFNKKSMDNIPITVYRKNAGQYGTVDLNNASGVQNGVSISNYRGTITAQSWGNNLFNMTRFVINNNEYQLVDTNSWGGLNIVKINKTNARVLEKKHFAFTTPLANDSVINYLNTFSENNILLIVKTSPYNTNFNMNSSLRARIRFLGSVYADSVNLQSYSCWSFVNIRTSPSVLSVESYNTAFNPAVCTTRPVFLYDSAYVYHNLGPAENWSYFNWSSDVPSNSALYFDVYGVNRSSQNVLLFGNITGSPNIQLDTVSAFTYPNIKLVTRFYIDSLNGVEPPVLKGMRFYYTPAAEIIADNNSFAVSDSVLNEGDTLNAAVSFGNYGYSDAQGYVTKWSATSPSGLRVLKTDTISGVLKIDSLVTTSAKLPTAGLRDRNRSYDTVTVYFEVSLIHQNEFFTYNNVAVSRFVIYGDTLKPEMDITYDGIRAISGEFIAAKPRIILKFLDNSKIFIKDTSNIRLKLDGEYVWYFNNGVKNPDIDIVFPTGKYQQATLYYNPSLSAGEHRFDFASTDATGNYSDTVVHYMYVNPELKIVDLKNYPNPMKNETLFLVNLSGEHPPSAAKIKIFTVAGRVIQTINANLSIGYNQIFWDGRDADGDYIANGVYLYKLIIEGDNKKETALQKLVILK
ncbi:MAG TPA: C25 family cysteine peptidase [Ignavibacteria bacterium]|nr:C25 family cysteine peptidase [Ignavibacteria bacterium]